MSKFRWSTIKIWPVMTRCCVSIFTAMSPNTNIVDGNLIHAEWMMNHGVGKNIHISCIMPPWNILSILHLENFVHMFKLKCFIRQLVFRFINTYLDMICILNIEAFTDHIFFCYTDMKGEWTINLNTLLYFCLFFIQCRQG